MRWDARSLLEIAVTGFQSSQVLRMVVSLARRDRFRQVLVSGFTSQRHGCAEPPAALSRRNHNECRRSACFNMCREASDLHSKAIQLVSIPSRSSNGSSVQIARRWSSGPPVRMAKASQYPVYCAISMITIRIECDRT